MKTPIAAPTRLSRLIQLNAKTSELMEFRQLQDGETDDDKSRIPAVAVGATAGIGATLAHQAVSRAGGYGAVGARATDYAGKVGTQFKYARNLGGTLRSGPLDIAKDFMKRAKGIRFESLVKLSAKLDELIEFGPFTAEQQKRQYEATGQKPENNLRRGLGLGFLGNSGVGAIAGAQDAAKFAKQGVVYRKRDAFGNSLGGGLLGVGVATGVGAALSRTKIGAGAALATRSAAGILSGYAGQRVLANRTLDKRKARFA